ncbi:MAG: 30S ribosomal protein S18 [Patescibacteria group bacterium]
MAKKDKKRRFKRFEEPIVTTGCPFCKAKTDPDYKESDILLKFMNDRAKIMNRDRTGVCAKHQRRLAVAVKRARHLALLPYVPQV